MTCELLKLWTTLFGRENRKLKQIGLVFNNKIVLESLLMISNDSKNRYWIGRQIISYTVVLDSCTKTVIL